MGGKEKHAFQFPHIQQRKNERQSNEIRKEREREREQDCEGGRDTLREWEIKQEREEREGG